MNRELSRRIALLEQVKNAMGIKYVVLDYPPEDDERAPYRLRAPMTEAEWMANYCQE